MNPEVDGLISEVKLWREEFKKLRQIILECQLTEEVKWRNPCYTFQKSNIVLIQGFKEYCALLFFKGVFLKDSKGILIKHGPNQQSARQIRFTNVQEIIELEPIVKSYIHEAIKVEKAGLKVKLKETSEYEIPKELQDKFNDIPDLKTAFERLTPGRQRGYILYFSAPKQSKTRTSRIEKYVLHILNGKGFNDK